MSEQVSAHDFEVSSKEYENGKKDKKQKLVRGGFQSAGSFGIPLVRKQHIDLDKDIVALCPACHGVKHFRNSERIGYGEHAKAHFLKVNQCTLMDFIRHYAEVTLLFEKRNYVLRWTLKVNLVKFGGKGMLIKERFIPLIDNPYAGVDFTTVNHVKTAERILSAPDSGIQYTTLLLTYEETKDPKSLAGRGGSPMYFSVQKEIDNSMLSFCPLPPKICLISVNDYDGTITVDSDYTNKIQWLSGNRVLRTKYNVAGRFTTKFSVEDLKEPEIRFVLFGAGGATGSQSFGLREA